MPVDLSVAKRRERKSEGSRKTMAKRDKEYEGRMQGMLYAATLVKEHDLEYLEKEIKRRGVLKTPLSYTEKQVDEFWNQLSANLYATMTCVTGMVLHDSFGFGKQRLHKFREEFQKATNASLDLDWLGGHYTTLEDYAVYLNEKYDMGLDVARIAVCQESHDEKEERYRMANLDRILTELKGNGFEDVAQFLESKI